MSLLELIMTVNLGAKILSSFFLFLYYKIPSFVQTNTSFFYMKKQILLLLVVLTSNFTLGTLNCQAQNINLTLADQLTYTQEALGSWGWKDPQDGKEYALVALGNGLSIVDVTNPSNIFQVVLIPGGGTCAWREVKTWGNHAYVTSDCGSMGVQIVNLLDLPSSNLQTATWAPNLSGQQLKTVHTLFADNGKAYLFGTNLGGAIVADITTNPMSPIYLGKYNPGYIHDGYVQNDTLYAARMNNGICAVVKLTNLASPQVLASFSTPGNFTHNTALSTNSKTCFTTDEVNNSFLAAYNISNFGNIYEDDRIQSNPGSNSAVHNTRIVQKNGVDYAINSWYSDGFTIVDASRPNNLVQVGNYDTSPLTGPGTYSGCWDANAFFPSGTIIATDTQKGLFVLTPTFARACYIEGVVTDCAGNPLGLAQVQIVNPPAYSVNSSADITDAAGKYGVGVLAPGTYSVTVSKSGFPTKTFVASVTAGNVTTLNVLLCTSTGVSESEYGNPNVVLYPNPFSETTTLEIKDLGIEIKDLQLQIYNVFGEMVLRSEINDSKHVITRRDLASGMYFYKILSGEKEFATGKIFME